MPKNFLDALESRRETKKIASREHGEGWTFDEESVRAYDDFFDPILEGRDLRSLVETLKSVHGTVRAANVLGGLRVLRELGVDEGTCVRLQKTRFSDPEKDTESFTTVLGDVLSKRTWRSVPEHQNLILSLGRGAAYSLPDNIELEFFLLQESWKRLDEGGFLLFQCPLDVEKELQRFKHRAQQQGKIGIWFKRETDKTDGAQYIALVMYKFPDSPDALPPYVTRRRV